jgi:hypothetical protein
LDVTLENPGVRPLSRKVEIWNLDSLDDALEKFVPQMIMEDKVVMMRMKRMNKVKKLKKLKKLWKGWKKWEVGKSGKSGKKGEKKKKRKKCKSRKSEKRRKRRNKLGLSCAKLRSSCG